jgi:hypothetical protein
MKDEFLGWFLGDTRLVNLIETVIICEGSARRPAKSGLYTGAILKIKTKKLWTKREVHQELAN